MVKFHYHENPNKETIAYPSQRESRSRSCSMLCVLVGAQKNCGLRIFRTEETDQGMVNCEMNVVSWGCFFDSTNQFFPGTENLVGGHRHATSPEEMLLTTLRDC